MKGFLLSFRSEFYKSRKTLGFWAAILLPLLISALALVIFYTQSHKFVRMDPMMLWVQFSMISLGIMGSLLLPMYTIFVAYSVNSIEHKADTWKTLFSLPISRWAVYSAKYFYAMFLVFLCLALFAIFTIGFGNLLASIKPELKFGQYHMEKQLLQLYFKMFLSSLGILSIQFLLSLLWADFLKPMGIGFVATITGVIMASKDWEYAYAFPYAHPMAALASAIKRGPGARRGPASEFVINILTNDVYVALGVAVVVFIAGYFIVRKRSVK
ncbi:ABC transporter permease [Mucilaginibacter pallidiroseus]|uniref:ABC transporter permease n=1 Tax=Mucilaginibacter pallidiroseus TaxID=2599295 RepID=A0A563UGQ1_9SPHI|nr:ABC transporter permease [Mucilaginibacter pallidiroseus]TWR30537.1 ABC transporter permease [Mucilaginibacter pallidiroseus]